MQESPQHTKNYFIFYRYPATIANDYPHADITNDLNRGHQGHFSQEISTNMLMEEEEIKKYLDKQVFLARANDPFGYSTKWEMR